MRETPRVSALVLARDEAHNLGPCLEALAWADERVVIVDAASRDDTEAIARRRADRVRVRPFDDFASQRNAALALASGDWVLAVDADERSTPEQAAEIRRAIADGPHAGYRVPIRSEVLGRPFRHSGTQHDLPLRLFRRDAGRWTGAVHETVDLRGTAGRLRSPLLHRTIPDMQTFLRKLDAYTTLEARQFRAEGRPVRVLDVTVRPAWTFAKLYVGKGGFRDGLEGFVFCAMSGLSVGVRHWKAPRVTPRRRSGMTMLHEREVSARFDALEARFRADISTTDARLRSIRHALGTLRGKRVLDLGCGKGRFAARLRDEGAEVVGLDLSAAMLATAGGIDRVRGSALRLPFAAGTFDGVVAVEVFEHLPEAGLDAALAEIGRVLRPGGVVAVLDKNAGALDARRPWLPSLAVKWVDEHRGRWMYPAGGPVRERWFWPEALRKRIGRRFEAARVDFLLSADEAGSTLFRRYPERRLMVAWTGRTPGGDVG